jgi:hypothetical protein
MEKCSKCGHNMTNVKPTKILLDAFESDKEQYVDGFIGECEVCGYKDSWFDI